MRGKGRYHELMELSKRELIKKVISFEGVHRMDIAKIKIRNEKVKLLEGVLHDLGYKIAE